MHYTFIIKNTPYTEHLIISYISTIVLIIEASERAN